MTTPGPTSRLVIDGRPLSFPGSGLAVVAAEVAAELGRRVGPGELTLVVDRDRGGGGLGRDIPGVRSLEVNSRAPGWRVVGRVLGVPDHFERMVWGRRVAAVLKGCPPGRRLFIPYFFNYGECRQNTVLVPDFIFRRPSRAPLVAKYRWLAWRHRLPLRRWLQDWEVRRVRQAHRLLVYSQHVAAEAREYLGSDADRVEVVTLGCPSWVQREYDPANDEDVKGRFGLPGRFILYAGGFAERKEVPLLLRACGPVWQSDPTFRCVVVGLSDERESAAANPEIASLFADETVAQSTVALPRCSYRDLASLLRLAEFVVYPSRDEGFGLPVVEAAAAGKLCLCSDATSLREVQPDPDLRVEAGDVDAWARAIRHFWRLDDLAGVSERAARRIAERQSWGPLGDRILASATDGV